MSFMLLGILNSQASGGAGPIGAPYWIAQFSNVNISNDVRNISIDIDYDGNTYYALEVEGGLSTLVTKYDLDMNYVWATARTQNEYSGTKAVVRKLRLLDHNGTLKPVTVGISYLNGKDRAWYARWNPDTGAVEKDAYSNYEVQTDTNMVDVLADKSSMFHSGYYFQSTNNFALNGVKPDLVNGNAGWYGGNSPSRHVGVQGNYVYVTGNHESARERYDGYLYNPANNTLALMFSKRGNDGSVTYGTAANSITGIGLHNNVWPPRAQPFHPTTGVPSPYYYYNSAVRELAGVRTDSEGNFYVMINNVNDYKITTLVKYDPTFTTVLWVRTITTSAGYALDMKDMTLDKSDNIYLTYTNSLTRTVGVAVKLPADGSVTGSVVLNGTTYTVATATAPQRVGGNNVNFSDFSFGQNQYNSFTTTTAIDPFSWSTPITTGIL